MNTVYYSIYGLQFLSSVSYSFLSTGLLPPLIGLFLGFYCFDEVVTGIVSLISSSDSFLLVNRNAKDFCILHFCILYPAFCTLQLYQIHPSAL